MSKISATPIRHRLNQSLLSGEVDVCRIDFPAEHEFRFGVSLPNANGQPGAGYPPELEGYGDPIAPLTRFLGAALTTASAV